MQFFTGNVAFGNKNQAGAPFPPGSADNGLSIDPITGKIVLGNDAIGAPGDARLLNEREIFTGGAAITLIDDVLFPGILFANRLEAIGILADDLTTGTQARLRNISTQSEVGLSYGPTVQNLLGSVDATGSELLLESSSASGGTSRLRFRDPLGTGNLIEFNNGLLEISDVTSNLLSFDSLADSITLGRPTGARLFIDESTGSADIIVATLNINGTPGFSGTVTPVTSITVTNGIVTAVS